MAAHTESHVVLTDKIRRWGGTILDCNSLSPDDKKELKPYIIKDENGTTEMKKSIPFRLVRAIHECLKKEEGVLSFDYLTRKHQCFDFHAMTDIYVALMLKLDI